MTKRTQLLKSTSATRSLLPVLVCLSALTACSPKQAPAETAKAPGSKAALTVELIAPSVRNWANELKAAGNIQPWQEAVVGAEVGGLRLLDVRVNVGDVVKKGQVLATLNASTVKADLLSAQAGLLEAKANLAQAEANWGRAQKLSPTGAVSQQDVVQFETQRDLMSARLQAAQAQLQSQELRLGYTQIVAPDDGVISSRTAAQGSTAQAGAELFRLIRKGKLEWRAEVDGDALTRIKVGQAAAVLAPNRQPLEGVVRQVAPSVDQTSRNGLVYVDLPATAGDQVKAGQYLSGALRFANNPGMSLPASAVVYRDGKALVFGVTEDKKLRAIALTTGQAEDNQIQVLAGLTAQDKVVKQGAGLLKAGDLVDVLPSAKRD